jgi:outer membrane lipoprotein-sorting protein
MKRALVFLLIIAFGFGCAPTKHARVAKRAAMDPRARDAIAALDERRAAIKTFRALGRATLTAFDEHEADIVLVLQLPNHMRMEAMDDVADVIARVASNGSRISASLPTEGKKISGRASPATLKRLMGVEWDMRDMVETLAGIAPLPEDAYLERASKGAGRFVDSQHKIELWMDMQRRVPLRFVQYDGTGGVEYEVRFSQYRNVQEVLIPHHIIAINPPGAERVEIRYREVQLNKDVQSRIFNAAT